MSLKSHLIPAFRNCSLLLLAVSIAWSGPERFLPYGSRVAVLDPWSGTHDDPEAKAIGDSLRSILGEDVVLVPAPSQALSGDSSTNPLPDSCADFECAAAWGRKAGADHVLLGSLSRADQARTWTVRWVDLAQGRVVRTLFENSPDSLSLARFAAPMAAHLMGSSPVKPTPGSSWIPRPSSSPIDIEIFKLEEDRNSAKSGALAFGVATVFGATIVVSTLSSQSHELFTESREVPLWFPATIILTGLGGVATIVELVRIGVDSGRLRHLRDKRKTSLLLLPVWDPVRGSGGVLAQAEF